MLLEKAQFDDDYNMNETLVYYEKYGKYKQELSMGGLNISQDRVC